MINLKPRMDGSVDVRDGRDVIARILPCDGAILIAIGRDPQPGPTIHCGGAEEFALTLDFGRAASTAPEPRP